MQPEEVETAKAEQLQGDAADDNPESVAKHEVEDVLRCFGLRGVKRSGRGYSVPPALPEVREPVLQAHLDHLKQRRERHRDGEVAQHEHLRPPAEKVRHDEDVEHAVLCGKM